MHIPINLFSLYFSIQCILNLDHAARPTSLNLNFSLNSRISQQQQQQQGSGGATGSCVGAIKSRSLYFLTTKYCEFLLNTVYHKEFLAYFGGTQNVKIGIIYLCVATIST